jgi:hypothetical protein
MTLAAVSGDAVRLAQCSMLRASPDATGRCCQVSVCNFIARAAAMVIDVACGPMAYNTQLLAYFLRRKPIVLFCDGMKKSDSDDINDECSIFNMKTL